MIIGRIRGKPQRILLEPVGQPVLVPVHVGVDADSVPCLDDRLEECQRDSLDLGFGKILLAIPLKVVKHRIVELPAFQEPDNILCLFDCLCLSESIRKPVHAIRDTPFLASRRVAFKLLVSAIPLSDPEYSKCYTGVLNLLPIYADWCSFCPVRLAVATIDIYAFNLSPHDPPPSSAATLAVSALICCCR